MGEVAKSIEFKEALRNVVFHCFDLLSDEENCDVMSVIIHIKDGILHHKYHIRNIGHLRHRSGILELEPELEESTRKHAISSFVMPDTIHAKSFFSSWILSKLRKTFTGTLIDKFNLVPTMMYLELYTLVRDDIGVFPIHDTVPLPVHTYTWELTESHRNDIRDYNKFNILYGYLETRLGARLQKFFDQTKNESRCSVKQFILW